MKLVKLRNSEEFLEYFKAIKDERLAFEDLVANDLKVKKELELYGYCECCNKAVKFKLDWKYSDNKTPNYRERMTCKYCNLNTRQRFMFSLLKKEIKHRQDLTSVYVYEQVTNFYSKIKEQYNDSLNIIGSEYLGNNILSGEIINNIRHEDALNLSFIDKSIDLIISNDVYEHVPDIERTFKESSRVLKDNGKLIFSIPFYANKNDVIKRAELKNNQIINNLPALYHGNPISAEGSLVFYDFGWDLLDICKNNGFNDAYMLAGYSLFYGYLGVIHFVFVAEKN